MADPVSIKYAEATDQELVLTYRKAPNDAIATELISRYRYHALGRCYELMGSGNAYAEDCYQESVVSFLQWLSGEGEIDSMAALWYTLTSRRCFDKMRQDKRYKRVLNKFLADFEKSHSDFMENADSVRLATEQIEKEQFVKKLTQQLPDFQRSSIELFYYDKLSYQEIADQLDRPLSLVKSALQNGKRHLRKLLGVDKTE